jgi:hypothetical protein
VHATSMPGLERSVLPVQNCGASTSEAPKSLLLLGGLEIWDHSRPSGYQKTS